MGYDLKFNKEEGKYLEAIFENLVENVNSTISVKENMISFYLKRLPDTTRTDAEANVDKIINGVATFTKNYEEFQSGDDTLIAMKLEEATKGMTLEQKYECMANFLIAIKSVDSDLVAENAQDSDFDGLKKYEEIKNKTVQVNPGTVTQEMIDELEALTKEAIENSSICIAGSKNVMALIKELPKNGDAAKEFATSNWNEITFKNYAALVTYIAFLEGGTPSIPADTDPEMIGASVAAGYERDKLIKQASLGQITWEYAKKMLKFIGGALLICFLGWAAIQIVTGIILLSAGLIGGFFNGALIGVIAGIVVGGFLAYHVVDTLVDVAQQVVSVVGLGYDHLMDLLTKGYEKLTVLVTETIYPTVKTGLSAVWNFINKNILQGILKVNVAKVDNEVELNIN